MTRRLLPALLVAAALLALIPADAAAQSQTPPGRTGLGGQIGDPSGVTLKLYRGTGTALDRSMNVDAVDFLAAWDLDDFFFLNVHAIHERPIQDSPLNVFLGPGLFLGIDEGPGDEDVVLGVSGVFGVNFFVEQFEVFIQLTPRLSLLPDTDGSFGGGVGLRYYF